MTMLPTFLAGTNFVMHSAGWLEGGLVSCYEKFIVDIELLRMLKHEFTAARGRRGEPRLRRPPGGRLRRALPRRGAHAAALPRLLLPAAAVLDGELRPLDAQRRPGRDRARRRRSGARRSTTYEQPPIDDGRARQAARLRRAAADRAGRRADPDAGVLSAWSTSTPTSSGARPTRKPSYDVVDRRRRRPRPGDRVLPREAATGSPTSRCSSAAGSAAATWAATRRSSAPTTSGTRARRSTSTRSSSGRGWRRSSTTTSCSASAACSTSRTTSRDVRERRAARQRQPAQRRRRGVARRRRRQGGLPDRRRPRRDVALPGARRDLPAARRDREARPRRLGLRARRRRARRRPDPGLRGHGDRRRRRPRRPACETSRGPIRGGRGRARRRRALLRARGDGRAAAAAPAPPAAGARLRAARAGPRLRGHVERGPRLRQPGAQGRAGDGRRASTPTTATASAAASTSSSAQMAAALELFPIFARAHVLRTWGGIVDVTPDASPIVGPTPVDGLYVNCGWGTGGFKAHARLGLGLRAHDRARRAASAQRRRSRWSASRAAR